MAIVTSTPAKLYLIEQWYEYEFPKIEKAYEELTNLMEMMKKQEYWGKLNIEQKYQMMEDINKRVYSLLGEAVLPF